MDLSISYSLRPYTLEAFSMFYFIISHTYNEWTKTILETPVSKIEKKEK